MCEDQGWSALELRVGLRPDGPELPGRALHGGGEFGLDPKGSYKLQGKQSCQERKSNQSLLCGSAGKLITLFFLQGWGGGGIRAFWSW